MRKTIIMTITAVAALTAGCSSSAEEVAAAAPSATVAVPAPSSAAAPTATAESLDAAVVLAELQSAGLPITDSAAVTETNDANNLIGRPGQYVSKVAFADNRVGQPIDQAAPGNDAGGSIEVFATASDAQTRSDYIRKSLASLGPAAGTEYHYLTGSALVRVTGVLPPSAAAEYETAVAAIG